VSPGRAVARSTLFESVSPPPPPSTVVRSTSAVEPESAGEALVYVNAAVSVACAFAPAGAPDGEACRATRHTLCPAVTMMGALTSGSPASIAPLQLVSRTRSTVQPGIAGVATCVDVIATEPALPAVKRCP